MLYQLSPSDLRRFYDDGYLIIEDLFSREEVEEMAEAAERIRALGREIAAVLPADEGVEERKIEHGGSQFVFGGIDRSMGST
ncbi:MAG TPA: phytanoyl-CoA dioxygenase family protein, partial [Thermoanaerobaculia bacterium]